MIAQKPSLYLDKGAIGKLDLRKVSEFCQIFYSEAILFDLLNDQSQSRDAELELLNDIGALYLFRDLDKVSSVKADAFDLFRNINTSELDIMADVYRFMNGGGSLGLFEVFQNQLSILLSIDNNASEEVQKIIEIISSNQYFNPLKSQKSRAWHIELQKATRPWSQDKNNTLHSIFEQKPELHEALKKYFPDEVEGPEQVHMAAMLLGVLQVASDRGVVSPDDKRSRKAAINGYVDCLHVMFGLHCDLFLTTDKATLRRFRLLNEFWQLGKTCALISKLN